jgi:N-acetylglucosamine kinase-like BadF-type ATPase
MPETYAGVDVGGSGIRVTVVSGDDRWTDADRGPAPRSAGRVDTRAMAARIGALVARTCRRATRVAVGLAGMPGLLEKPSQLAEDVNRAIPAGSVIVASDALTTHMGALTGRPGCVVAAGTGVIVLATDHRTVWRQADGWGHLLGDEGSGAWVGARALHAALRHHDGRPSGSAALYEKLRQHFGDTDTALDRVYGAGSAAHELAAFAPLAAEAAHDGDPVAKDIWRRAGTLLAESAHAAARDLPPDFSWGGRLFDAGALLLSPFQEELCRRVPGARLSEPAGQSADGALLLARRGLPASHPDLARFAVEFTTGA